MQTTKHLLYIKFAEKCNKQCNHITRWSKYALYKAEQFKHLFPPPSVHPMFCGAINTSCLDPVSSSQCWSGVSKATLHSRAVVRIVNNSPLLSCRDPVGALASAFQEAANATEYDRIQSSPLVCMRTPQDSYGAYNYLGQVQSGQGEGKPESKTRHAVRDICSALEMVPGYVATRLPKTQETQLRDIWILASNIDSCFPNSVSASRHVSLQDHRIFVVK